MMRHFLTFARVHKSPDASTRALKQALIDLAETDRRTLSKYFRVTLEAHVAQSGTSASVGIKKMKIDLENYIIHPSKKKKQSGTRE